MKKTVLLRRAAALALAVLLFVSQPAALAAYQTLEYGMRGTEVLELQTALKTLGFDTNGIDGKFGPGTRTAVKAYQKARGLTVDGKAGAITQSVLYAEIDKLTSGSGPVTTNPDTLKYGSSGSRVTELQTNLKKLGYYTGSVDGKFGAGTQRAVIAFQSANKLTPDGLAGTQTITLLNKLAANAGSSGGSSSGSTGSTGSTGSSSVPSILTRTLRRGYTGEDVKTVQNRLKELGYHTSAVDGVYGLGTMSSVTDFQKRHGLYADGLAGQQTFQVMFSSSALPAIGSSSGSSGSTGSGSTSVIPNGVGRTLQLGSAGEDVRKVQTRLQELGYYTYTVDGIYGPTTMAAVVQFQTRNRLSSDGIAGTQTFAVLFSSSAIKADNSTSGGSSSSSGVTYPRLAAGSKGEEVRKMQQALKNLNYPVTVDGAFGPNTTAAVKLFQGVNGLSADGIAAQATLALLYSGTAKAYSGSVSSPSGSGKVPSNAGASSMSSFTGSNGKKIQLLHWQNEIKPYLKTGQNLLVYDPATTISFTLYVMSRGRHCDVEPLTATDTARMMDAWGGKVTWTPRPVYIGLPDGRWTLAVMHNVAHGSQVINGNNFDGQNCVHFLRDMSECTKNDPDYGVTNQNALRKAWKSYTGITVD